MDANLPKISEVLREALTYMAFPGDRRFSKFICCCIDHAARKLCQGDLSQSAALCHRTIRGLQEMGMGCGGRPFKEFEGGHDVLWVHATEAGQFARAMFLEWAILMAEEQGV